MAISSVTVIILRRIIICRIYSDGMKGLDGWKSDAHRRHFEYAEKPTILLLGFKVKLFDYLLEW